MAFDGPSHCFVAFIMWKSKVAVVGLLSLFVVGMKQDLSYALEQSKDSWANMHGFDKVAIAKAKHITWGNLYDASFTPKDYEFVSKDEEHRIKKEFLVPQFLKPSFDFWLKIYTQYSTRQALLVDSEHLDVVYDVIDLRDLEKSSRNAVVFELNCKARVDKAIKKYKAAFASLKKHPSPKKPNHEEKHILEAIKKLPDTHSFTDLQSHLKIIKGQRDQIIRGLVTAEAFLPKMEAIFQKLQVPVELTRIPFLESSFNLKAGSRVGAYGVWQIMPKVGKSYLLLDPHLKIDERMSPLKSAVAAGKLLKFNYKYLGNWVSAVVAYNHGLRNLPRLKNDGMHYDKVSYLFEESTTKGRLGFASRNYFPGFLAILYAEAYQEKFYGTIPTPHKKEVGYRQLPRAESSEQFIREAKVNVDEFKFYDGDVKDLKQILPKGFWVAVPGDKGQIENILHRLDGRRVVKAHHAKLAHHAKRKHLAVKT